MRLAIACAVLGVSLRAAAQPAPPAVGRPTLELENFVPVGGLTATPRLEQERILVALIADTPDSEVEEKSDYLFRLGDLYSAQVRGLVRGGATPKAKEMVLKAVKAWKQLVDNDAFRNYAKMDLALFEFGYTLQLAGFMKEARAVYNKLLKSYPQSPFVAQAHLAFAEYYLAAGQPADAEVHFQYVLRLPVSPSRAFAMYRIAWIQYDLQHDAEALAAFTSVIESTKSDATQVAIYDAARQGLIATYARIGKPSQAAVTFAKIDATAQIPMLEALAERTGKPEDAVVLYRELMKIGPEHPHVCRWQVGVATRVLAMPSASADAKTREVENLVKLSVALEKAQALVPDEQAACRERTNELAKSIRAKSAELAWQRATAETAAARQLERWAVAADAYFDVAQSAADPQVVRDAAARSVLAWKKALAVDPRLEVQAGPIDLEAAARAKPAKIAVPEREAKLLDAFALYESTTTDPDEIARTKFLRATLLRRQGDHALAVTALTELLGSYREHATAELAATLLLDSLVRLRRFDETLAAADGFAADAKFLAGKPVLAAQIKLLRSRSLRR